MEDLVAFYLLPPEPRWLPDGYEDPRGGLYFIMLDYSKLHYIVNLIVNCIISLIISYHIILCMLLYTSCITVQH